MQLRQLIDALLAITGSDSKRYNRQICYQTHTDLRNNHTLSADDSFIYFAGSNGLLKSDLSDPVLTYEGCMAICGTMMGWYDDWLPRLLTWLVPIVLLVACMQYGNIGPKKFSLIPFLFGDPIFSFDSLISTVELSNRCHVYASEFLKRIQPEERVQSEERFRELRVLVPRELATIILAFVEVRAKAKESDRSEAVEFDAVQALWAVLDKAFPDSTGQTPSHSSNISSPASVTANVGTNTAAVRNDLRADLHGVGQTSVDIVTEFEEGIDRAFADPTRLNLLLSNDGSSTAGPRNQSRADLFKHLYKRLKKDRSHKKLETILSLAFYIFQVIIAFFPNLADTIAPSSGRIGPTMLLSFILATVPLSNLIGNPRSYKNTEDELSIFMENLGILTNDQPALCERIESRCCFIQRKTKGPKTEFHESLAWSGGTSVYRPDIRLKMLQGIFRSNSTPDPSLEMMERGLHGTSPNLFLFTSQERQRGLRPKKRYHFPTAAFPVILAFLTAIVINQQPPESFSCRSLLAFGVVIVWIISWLITEAVVALNFATGFYQWRIILAKNLIVALLVLGSIISNSCGLLNNCWCSSGVLTQGLSKAYLALNPLNLFDLNDLKIYPAIVTVAFSLQFSFPMFIVYVIGRSGFREMAGWLFPSSAYARVILRFCTSLVRR